MLDICVATLFPGFFESPLSSSILGRAKKSASKPLADVRAAFWKMVVKPAGPPVMVLFSWRPSSS